MYFRIWEHLAGLERVAKQHKKLRKKEPEELTELREAQSKLTAAANVYFDYWKDCQGWDGAGKVTLATAREVSEDYGIEFNSNTRRLIRSIENEYRKSEANKRQR